MSDWQPIETAPKDRRVDLWNGIRETDCYWGMPNEAFYDGHPDTWVRDGDEIRGMIVEDVTHWMEIPDPPA